MWSLTSTGGRHRRESTGSAIAELMSVLRTAVLAGVTGMVLIATAPVIFGWRPTVVVSGSMLPKIEPGDVVVARPVAARMRSQIMPGTIVLVRNPAEPDELLLHRLVRYDLRGQMVTKGDANAGEDSTPVPLDHVRGVARVRVPFIGLPFLWVRQRRYLPAAATVVLLLALAAWRPHPDVNRDPRSNTQATPLRIRQMNSGSGGRLPVRVEIP
jgi:signal peptidase